MSRDVGAVTASPNERTFPALIAQNDEIDAYRSSGDLCTIDKAAPERHVHVLTLPLSLIDIRARLDVLDQTESALNVIVPVPWLEAFRKVYSDPVLAAEAARSMNDDYKALVERNATLRLHPSRPPIIPDYTDEKLSQIQCYYFSARWLVTTGSRS